MTKNSRNYPKERVNLWIFKDLHDAIRRQAYIESITVIAYVNRLIMKHAVSELGFKPTEMTNKSVEPNE